MTKCFKRNGPCLCSASIEICIHLKSWEKLEKPTFPLPPPPQTAAGYRGHTCYSDASLVLSQLSTCIYNSIYAPSKLASNTAALFPSPKATVLEATSKQDVGKPSASNEWLKRSLLNWTSDYLQQSEADKLFFFC